jgi:WD40 repeat protein
MMCVRTLGSLAASAFLLGTLVVVPFLPAADEALPNLTMTLRGHKDAVYAIAFTSDGKQIVTGSGDPSIKVWQADTGKEFKTFGGANGHTGLVLALALSPDGTAIASGGADNTLRVWDFPTSKPLREFPLATDSRSVAVSPDGLRLVGGSDMGVVRVWNAVDGKQLHELTGHAGAVTGLAFSPNGQTVASVGHDGTLRYWNAADGKSLGSCVAHPGPVSGVSFNAAGSMVYTTGPDGTLRFWTLPPTPSKPLTPKFEAPISVLSLSSDGSQIVTGAGKVVRLSTTNTLQQKREFIGATGAIRSVAASAGGALVAAGTDDKRLLLWKDKEVALVNLPAHAGAVTGVAFNQGGNQLASVGKDGVLRLWSVPPAAPREVVHPDAVVASGLSGDGLRLLTAAADKTLRLYKLDNPKTPERQFMGLAGAAGAVALSADGKAFVSGGADGTIRHWTSAKAEPNGVVGAHSAALISLQSVGADRFLSSSADGTVKLWQTAPAQKNAVLSHAGAVSAAVLSADGAKLVTGCDDKQVRIWTLATGAIERTLPGPTLAVSCVAINTKGGRIAAGSADKSVYVWEAGGKLAMKSPALSAAVTGVALTGDGKQVVAALADGSVRVLDVMTSKEVKSLAAHKSAASALAITPRGDQVVSAGADGTVTLGPLAGGAAVATIPRGSPVTSLALSSDGLRVAVGGADKGVKVYALPSGKLESTIATDAEVRGLSFGADNKRLAVAGGDGKTRLFDAAGALEESFAQEGAVNAVAFAADGKTVFTAGADKSARRWSPALVWQDRHDAAASRAVMNGRGDRVVSAGADGMVKVWNATDGKPVQAIRAHVGAVAGIAVSPDAGKIVSVGADRVARLWDLSKLPAAKSGGKEIDKAALEMPLPDKCEPLTCSLNPVGTRLAVGVAIAGKEQVRVFDAATGKELIALGEADGMPGRSLSWLADGRSLVASGADKSVRIVDVNVLGAFEAHAGGCAGVAWHSNGTQVLTGGADKSVKLWTVATGKLDRTFPAMDGPVDAVNFSNDFGQVAAVAGKSARIWATADGKQLAAKELPSPAKGITINSDRTRFAVACDDGQARVYESATGTFLQGFAHTGAVSAALFAPFSPTLFTAGVDQTVSQHTLSARNAYDAKTALAGLSVSPNSAQIATAGADGKVRLYNASTGVLDKTIDAEKPQTCVAFSRNSDLVACGGSDSKVRLFKIDDGKMLSVFTAPSVPRGLGFHPNNRSLVMAGADGAVVAWDIIHTPGQPLPVEFGKVQQTFAHAAGAFELAIPASTTNAVFYSAGADKTIKAFKLASETAIRNIPHPNTVNSLAYDKEGTILVTGCGDGQVRLYDIAKGALSKAIVAHPGMPNQPSAVYAVAFSPDGKSILSGSYDQSLKLWSVPDGKLIREFKGYKAKTSEKGHQEAVLCAAFSPDGTRIASGGMDRAIKIWNVATGEVERELIDPATKPPSAHPGWVYALRWIDGGKKIVSVGGAPRLKGSMATWDTATGKLLEGKELAVGTIYALGVSADEKLLGLGTGGSLRAEKDYNTGLILKR